MPLTAKLAEAKVAAEDAGQTPVFVGWDGAIRAAIVVADTIKPDQRRRRRRHADPRAHPDPPHG